MQLKWLESLVNRLEALSLREQAMVVLGVPLALAALAEWLVFDPAGKRAATAQLRTEQLQSELKALTAALAAQPAVAQLPGVDQLKQQRDELQGRIDAARVAMAGVDRTVDWATVVRATVAGNSGLTLTQLKAVQPELVYSPATAKSPGAATSRPGAPGVAAKASVPAARRGAAPASAAAAPVALGEPIYRHRAELTVKGDLGRVLGYVQALQQIPGDLRWDRLQLSLTGYPQASVQMNLQILSNRAETPFN